MFNLFNQKCGENNHRYQARYDEEPISKSLSVSNFRGSVREFIIKKYVRDVCVKCGKTIERT